MGLFGSKKEPKKPKAQIYLEERGVTNLSEESFQEDREQICELIKEI